MIEAEMKRYIGQGIFLGTNGKEVLRPLPSLPITGFRGTKEALITEIYEEPGNGAVFLKVRVREGQGTTKDKELVIDFNDPCWRLRFPELVKVRGKK